MPVALYTTDQAHLSHVGWFDPERMRQFWRQRSAEAEASGIRHIRAVAEMAWALRKLPGTEEAPVFESSLNEVLPPSRLSVICQYGSSRFNAETVLAMILSHPYVVIGRSVFTNPFTVSHHMFPGRFQELRTDAVAALLPIWTFFLGQLGSVSEVAKAVCTSVPAFLDAEEVRVFLKGMAGPLKLNVTRDRVEPDDSSASIDNALRLHAMWPASSDRAGGAVYIGSTTLQATFDGVGHVAATRLGPFTGREASTFTVLSGRLSTVIGHLRSRE
jgi:hypothetical protein